MICSRVTDHGRRGAWYCFALDGQVRLERLHCLSEDQLPKMYGSCDGSGTRRLQPALSARPRNQPSCRWTANVSLLSLETNRQVIATWETIFQLNLAPLHCAAMSSGDGCIVFSRDPDYTWTETRQKLVRLVADQTSVAIENDELTRRPCEKRERLGS